MTGPATPGQEGPSFAPPPLPEGWIAQWDGMSKKYYFVQLSTGASQWETPTHAAPTGPTPQATPQGVEHPYGTPAGQGEMGSPMGGEFIENADGSRSVRFDDGRVERVPEDGERGLGSFAMQQLLGGKKQNQGGLGQLSGLASQFLSSGSSHSNQSTSGGSGASGIVGALAGQLLGGGKKHEAPQSYSGGQNTQQQSHGGGFMGNLGSMFSGHNSGSGSSFGYSQHDNQQGGYTGSAPPTSYQPSGTGSSNYMPPPPPQSHPYANQNKPPQSYGTPEHSYGQSPNQQQPPYGAPSSQPPYGGAPPSQQPSYSSHTPSGQQPPYGGGQQPPYGGIQHQPSYGSGQPPPQSQQYPAPPSYEQGSGGYGARPNPQPGHYAEMSGGLYGNGSGSGQGPNVPMGSHPHHGQQYQSQQPPRPPPGQPGSYSGAGYQGQQGRW